MTTGECQLWQGAISDEGYPRHQGEYVHRRVWESLHGPIPDGMQVDHACHNATGCHRGSGCPHRRCINPAHLQLVTVRVNNLLKLAPVGWETRILTHCRRDHPREAWNIYTGRDGKRRCMACRREDQRALQARRRRERLALAGQLAFDL